MDGLSRASSDFVCIDCLMVYVVLSDCVWVIALFVSQRCYIDCRWSGEPSIGIRSEELHCNPVDHTGIDCVMVYGDLPNCVYVAAFFVSQV